MKRVIRGGVFALLGCGCSLMVHPFGDEQAERPPVTTPSVRAVQAANVPPSPTQSFGEPKTRLPVDGSVTHGPLYFEDPYEESGSEDGRFAWTGEDYWWMVYWRGRFMVNLVAWPVSAVVHPPWQVMASDGRLSGTGRGAEFDAEPMAKDH